MDLWVASASKNIEYCDEIEKNVRSEWEEYTDYFFEGSKGI